MDLRRLRVGEWTAGAFGVVLVVAMFLPWFARPVPCAAAPCPTDPTTAWSAFAVIDVLIALVALMGIADWLVTTIYRTPAVPTALASLTALIGTVVLVVVLVRVAMPPDGALRLGGLWLGLAALIGVALGGWVAMRDESYGFWPSQDAGAGHPERARAVEVTQLPAPPADREATG